MARRAGDLAEAPLFIDDSPNLTMMEIRAKARRLRQRHDLQLIVIDYLQLMTSGKRVESRQQEVSEFSRRSSCWPRSWSVPVVALSQLNRGPEQRTDKKPMLADLRESGSIEQDSDMVMLVHREDMYERESPRAGEADLIIAKHRNGPTATVAVASRATSAGSPTCPNRTLAGRIRPGREVLLRSSVNPRGSPDLAPEGLKDHPVLGLALTLATRGGARRGARRTRAASCQLRCPELTARVHWPGMVSPPRWVAAVPARPSSLKAACVHIPSVRERSDEMPTSASIAAGLPGQ